MPPQAFTSSYGPRLRTYNNSLLTPVLQPSNAQSERTSRTTKRGTIAINYAEDGYDDDDLFEESDAPKRPTGLRSLRRDDTGQDKAAAAADRFGKETSGPVAVQGIWRDWMGRPKFGKTDTQLHAQVALPLTLIPIRIDLDIPSFTPPPALPLPSNPAEFGINPALPAYRPSDTTPPYRLRDTFLWNLHETLVTPDQFASMLTSDLDLPNHGATAMQISNQIRQQLEEYAGVALHPLFHATQHSAINGATVKTIRGGASRDVSSTPAATNAPTPVTNGASIQPQAKANGAESPAKDVNHITAEATPIAELHGPEDLNPDDTYRCIITLNINLLNKLYTDKFEWSLLHPPGVAEIFAKQTCADLGLAGEWVPAMTHAIYEAVLRLKKEACESGGLVGGTGVGGEIENFAAEGAEAGWRFNHENVAHEWEPRVETLSKEEIEKREGDRERQIRRLRRETARFSSSTGMTGGMPHGIGASGYPEATEAETPMGRGERAKKKRRFRSISPAGRSNTPGGGRGTPDGGTGYGGGGGSLMDWERQTWRCAHCLVWGSGVWAVRDGPKGHRSLCNNCGFLYERDHKLPPWSKDLHRHDVPPGRY